MGEVDFGDHLAYMRAVLVDAKNRVLATGFTLELPGNTHAEQCCLMKLAEACGVPENDVADVLPAGCVLYTTVEPCEQRLSGNKPCVDRIAETKKGNNGGIATVYVGVQEPTTFIAQNAGRAKLEAAGIACVHIAGLEDEILKVAKAGHHATGS